MTQDEYRLLIPQYLSGQLTQDENRIFAEQLAVNADLRIELEELRTLWEGLAEVPEEQPSLTMRARFYQKLNALSHPRPAAEPRRANWNVGSLWQVALALFIFVLGIYVGRGKSDEVGHTAQLAQMNAQVQSLREIVALSLLDRQSATSRLEGVSWSSRVDKPNEELLSALLNALNQDSNVNVRLSSINALEGFSQNSQVRQALIDSILRQDSPLVQIALIDSLVQIHNRAAEPALKTLATNTEVDPAVRQRAEWGLQKLSYQ